MHNYLVKITTISYDFYSSLAAAAFFASEFLRILIPINAPNPATATKNNALIKYSPIQIRKSIMLLPPSYLTIIKHSFSYFNFFAPYLGDFLQVYPYIEAFFKQNLSFPQLKTPDFLFQCP